jgi:hypothetical protein
MSLRKADDFASLYARPSINPWPPTAPPRLYEGLKMPFIDPPANRINAPSKNLGRLQHGIPCFRFNRIEKYHLGSDHS